MKESVLFEVDELLLLLLLLLEVAEETPPLNKAEALWGDNKAYLSSLFLKKKVKEINVRI